MKSNFPIEAIGAIYDTLIYGSSKGHPERSWCKESIEHHVNKANGHLKDFLYGVDRGEDHLACALCRLAMAVSVREILETEREEEELNKKWIKEVLT